MGRVAAEAVNRWRRSLLPTALVAIGLITVIFGDFTGDHRVRGRRRDRWGGNPDGGCRMVVAAS
jgi:hypothetical protein